jgi:hypothetical protein
VIGLAAGGRCALCGSTLSALRWRCDDCVPLGYATLLCCPRCIKLHSDRHLIRITTVEERRDRAPSDHGWPLVHGRSPGSPCAITGAAAAARWSEVSCLRCLVHGALRDEHVAKWLAYRLAQQGLYTDELVELARRITSWKNRR